MTGESTGAVTFRKEWGECPSPEPRMSLVRGCLVRSRIQIHPAVVGSGTSETTFSDLEHEPIDSVRETLD